MKRDFLKLTDLSAAEARAIYERAGAFKRDRRNERPRGGESIAIVLEKPSTRTRVSFELAVVTLGMHPVVLDMASSQLGRGEPVKDTARVLSRYCRAIVYRTSSEERLDEMASYASVPVVNALSDSGHPVQVLCDIFTIEEAFAKRGDARGIAGRRVAFVGDCSSNMARSWLEAAPLFGFHLVLSGPARYMPPLALRAAAKKGEHMTECNDPARAVEGCDVVNTDVWASMGQEASATERREALEGWTVNRAMMSKARADAMVLHCLPAHRGEEIDDETIEGERSIVWDQAENRLHVQRGLLDWLLGEVSP